MLWFESCDSTMDICHRFASFHKENLIIGSSKQISGRGTKNRLWVSPEGNLYLSILIFPQNRHIQTLHMIGAITILKLLQSEFGQSPSIKWPNDIIIDGKKICGVLQENVFENQKLEYSIIGIGLNVNMENNFKIDIPYTSIKLSTSKSIDVKKLGKKVSNLFFNYYLSDLTDQEITNIWIENIDTIGKKIRLSLLNGSYLEGEVVAIDNNGDLVLKTKSDENKIIKSGMVHKMQINK